MVFQMPYADKKHVFAASDRENAGQARREVLRWARGHGYRNAHSRRVFTIFHADAEPREWLLLERRGEGS